MSWQFPAKKNKAAITYLLIILAFALLAWCVHMFFNLRIKAIEKADKPAYEITQLRWTSDTSL
jgi:hypothetical protein